VVVVEIGVRVLVEVLELRIDQRRVRELAPVEPVDELALDHRLDELDGGRADVVLARGASLELGQELLVRGVSVVREFVDLEVLLELGDVVRVDVVGPVVHEQLALGFGDGHGGRPSRGRGGSLG
jgi:hypothetical protein